MPTAGPTQEELKSRRGVFAAAVIAQAMIPLLLWPVELLNRPGLSDATIALTAPLWSLSLATSCRRAELFIGSLGLAVLQALMFGGYIKEPEKFSLHPGTRWAIIGSMALVAIMFGRDRREAHIEKGEAFGPFAAK
jgi:hypothetical protein